MYRGLSKVETDVFPSRARRTPGVSQGLCAITILKNRGRTSAYGLSSWTEKSVDGVAAANLAAAESLPIFPRGFQLRSYVGLSESLLRTPIVAIAACTDER